MSVAQNIARIKDIIGTAPVRLIAVTKNVSADLVYEAFECGVTEFGENRVQDALDKQLQVPPSMADKVQWHLIGHLQTNKVKKVVGKFSLIHSVDSLHLAEVISAEAKKISVVQPILIQVKVVADPGKSGFTPEEIKSEFAKIQALPNLRIEGLMTIAPFTANTDTWQASFGGLRDLRDELEQQYSVQLKELSMGMSGDWQQAIACGSTMVRIGRAIFAGGSAGSRLS